MRRLTIVLTAILGLILASCGGGSNVQPLRSDGSLADDNPLTAPLVGVSFNGFNAETTTLRFSEGETITFRIDMIGTNVVEGSLSQTSGPRVNFGTMSAAGEDSLGDLDTASGNSVFNFTLEDVEGTRRARIDTFQRLTVDFRAPSVTQRTTLNFRFQSRTGSTSRDRIIPVIIEDDAAALTIEGHVSKGLVTNTDIRLFSIDGLDLGITGIREIIERVRIDETGQYSFTVLPATDVEDLLRFEVEGDGADMICDAPQGCNDYAFGEVFEVEDDLDLRALIEVPQFGTTRVANVNLMTTLASGRAGKLNNLRRVSPEDLEDARRDVASVFGIPNQDFSNVPFIDITQPFVSSDENAVRIAMIGGGILGATFLHSDPDDDEDYLEELDEFIEDFEDRELFCRNSADQTTLSMEDIISQALEISQIHGDLLIQNFFQNRLTQIRNGSFNCEFFTPPLPSQGG